MDKTQIKQKRKQQKYTQETLARLLDITLRSYQKIENDNEYLPNVLTGLKLAKILDIDPYTLWKI